MRYNEMDFITSCKMFGYCGVGVRHQNGIAEAKNKTIIYGASTILLHAKMMWSKVIEAAL